MTLAYSFFPKQVKVISEALDPTTGKIGRGPLPKKGTTNNVSKLTETFKTTIPFEKITKNKKASIEVLSQMTHKYDPKEIEKFAQSKDFKIINWLFNNYGVK